jgi:phosphatidylcholine synthase
VHPLRVVRMRPMTIAATVAWVVFAAAAIAERLEPDLWVKLGLIVTALYFLGLPFLRHSPWAEDKEAG